MIVFVTRALTCSLVVSVRFIFDRFLLVALPLVHHLLDETKTSEGKHGGNSSHSYVCHAAFTREERLAVGYLDFPFFL